MLFYKTIDKSTLELLKKVQKNDLFKDLRLVGGTSLALQIGHRISVDLDLFGIIPEKKLEITTALNTIGEVKTIHFTKNIAIYSIDGIKVDIVNYPYPWLEKEIIDDELLLANKMDIAAMKLAAITGRGSKKDFIDIFFLLQEYSFKQMLEFYNQKYADGSTFLVLKSMAYFENADEELMPRMLKNIAWDEVKETIKNTVQEYITKDM